MELTQAYVRAFGNIENRTFNFQKGINTFLENNGEGKTTLANFLLARFYGFGARRNSQERERYLPYSKEDCGGSLEFTDQGKTYRIERHFGNTAKSDTVKFFCNGKEREIEDEPGAQFFGGLDRESFRKLVFLTPEDLTISSTESIDSKRGQYTDGTGQGNTFDDIKDKLVVFQRTFKPARNAQKSGKIAECRLKINEIEELQQNRDEKQEELDKDYADLDLLEQEIKDNRKKQDEAMKINASIEVYKSLSDKQKMVEEAKALVEKKKTGFPCGIPSEDELQDVEKAIATKDSITSFQDSSPLSDTEKAKYHQLKEKFADGIPSTEILEKVRKDVYDYLRRKNARPASLLSDEEEEILKRFSLHPINRDEAKNAYANYKEAKKEYEADSKNAPAGKKSLPASLIVFLALSLATLLAGIFLGLLLSKWCYLLLLPAVVFAVRGFLKKEKEGDQTIPNKEKEVFAKQTAVMKKILGIQGDDVEEAYGRLSSDYVRYASLLAKKEEEDRLHNEKKEALSNYQKSLSDFFSKYKLFSDDYESCLITLSNEVSTFDRLQNKAKDFEIKKQENKKAIQECTAKIDHFLEKYRLSSLTNLRQKIADYNTAISNWKSADRQLENYRSEKNISPTQKRDNLQPIDRNPLTEKRNELSDQKAERVRRIEENEDRINTWNEQIATLPDLKERYGKLSHKEERIKKTIEFLDQAEDKIKFRYIQPRKERFVHYSDRLEKIWGTKVSFDTSFNVSLIEKGNTVDYTHLSSGQRALVLLCYTLALLDNIFKEDRPFLIRDDLFMFLDEDHRKKAKDFLDEISKDRQIVYFTCHPSRMI